MIDTFNILWLFLSYTHGGIKKDILESTRGENQHMRQMLVPFDTDRERVRERSLLSMYNLSYIVDFPSWFKIRGTTCLSKTKS